MIAGMRLPCMAGPPRRHWSAATLPECRDFPWAAISSRGPCSRPRPADKFKQHVEGLAVRAALAAPTELRGLPLGGRVDPGDIPSLQQLGLQPLPAGCSAGSRGSSSAAPLATAASTAAAAGSKGAAAIDGKARGGEGEALRQLQRFVSQAAGAAGGRGAGSAYGSNFASSIAPWLATGCLSPRRMLEDVKAAVGQACGSEGAAQGACASVTSATGPAPQPPLTWVRFELLWRDFFRFMTLKYSSLSARQLGNGAAGAGAAAATAQPALAAAV